MTVAPSIGKRIAVQIGRERPDRHFPHATCVLLERRYGHTRESVCQHRLGVRRGKPQRHAAIGMYFRRHKLSEKILFHEIPPR